MYLTIFQGVSALRRLDKLQRIATIDIINLCLYYELSRIEIEEVIYVIDALDKKAIEREQQRQKEAVENVNR